MASERRQRRILSILRKAAEAVNPVSSARIAAAVVYRGDIVSFGHNQKKSHPFQAKFGKNEGCIYLHAEVDAIKNALRCMPVEELRNADLYISRAKRPEPRSSKFVSGLAKPCTGCLKAIVAFGIRNVFYTCDDGSTATL